MSESIGKLVEAGKKSDMETLKNTTVDKTMDKTKTPSKMVEPVKKLPRIIIIMNNKPDEPVFQLQIGVRDVRFVIIDTEFPQYTHVKITNTSQKRQCIKLKSTDNELFRIQPAYTTIEPNETLFAKISLTKLPEFLPLNLDEAEEKEKEKEKEKPATKTKEETKDDGKDDGGKDENNDNRDYIAVFHTATDKQPATVKEFKEIFKKQVDGMVRICISYVNNIGDTPDYDNNNNKKE